jgi:hypothetical protein
MIDHEQALKLEEEHLLNQVDMHEETLSKIIHQNKRKHPQDHPPKGAHKYSMVEKMRREKIEVFLTSGELWFTKEVVLAFKCKQTLALKTLKSP